MHKARLKVQKAVNGGQLGNGQNVGARILSSRLLGNLSSLSSVKRSRTFNVSDVNDLPNGAGEKKALLQCPTM